MKTNFLCARGDFTDEHKGGPTGLKQDAVLGAVLLTANSELTENGATKFQVSRNCCET